MITVGIRELKDKLSLYLKRVEQGAWVEVTNRGKVVALLIPARRRKAAEELLELVEEGLASWSGGKPQGSLQPVQVRGRLLSEMILEDRG